MELHNRFLRFAFTVVAMQDVAQLCPNKDIRRLAEVFEVDADKPLDYGVIAKFAAALSYWGEQKERWENPGYKPNPFTEEELLALSPAEIRGVFEEMTKAIRQDNAVSVEAEPAEKK